MSVIRMKAREALALGCREPGFIDSFSQIVRARFLPLPWCEGPAPSALTGGFTICPLPTFLRGLIALSLISLNQRFAGFELVG